jgi:NAD(P)-dependent dehydrogenase (short-subunit alcohol dehydrogenase family)
MQAQGSGRIIAIAGDSWFEAWPNHVAHGVSKSGLVRLMQYLAVTLSPSVQCNVICPAKIMPTDDASNAQLSSGRGQGTFEGLLELAPDVHLRRGGAEEVAELIIHLAHCTPYLSGAVIPLDGGKSVF